MGRSLRRSNICHIEINSEVDFQTLFPVIKNNYFHEVIKTDVVGLINKDLRSFEGPLTFASRLIHKIVLSRFIQRKSNRQT